MGRGGGGGGSGPPLENHKCYQALLTLHVMTEMHFLLQKKTKKYHVWSCQNVCDALTFLLDNILFNLAPSCIDK